MKINGKLLSVKAQFFFNTGGAAPIIPFIPIILKELGFSSVSVGWTYTVYPIIILFFKPLIGLLSDKFKNQKVILLSLLLIQAFAPYCLRYVPELPSSVPFSCEGNVNVRLCSDKLKDECFLEGLKNLSLIYKCKINLLQSNLYLKNISSNGVLKDSYIISETSKEISVLLERGNIWDGCLSLALKNETKFLPKWSSECNSGFTSAKIDCENEFLNQLLNEPAISDEEVTFTNQFWMVFFIVTSARVSMSVVFSLIDTVCFQMLGDETEDYGKQRLWGSLSWGLVSSINGFIIDYLSKGKTKKDYTLSFNIMLLFYTIHFLILASVKVKKVNKSKSIVKDVGNLFKSPKIFIFLVWCIISGIYVSLIWNFLFWFIEDLAALNGCGNRSWIKTLEGWVLTVQTLCGEIPLFFLSGAILKKIGHINAMSLVLITFGVRFILYSALTDPWWILPIESLNGITFGLFSATMTTYASDMSPPGTEATVQNLVTAAFEGVGTALGALLGGYMFRALGSSQTFLMAGFSALIFGIIHIIVQKIMKNTNPDIYKSVVLKKVVKETENGDKCIVFNKVDNTLQQ